ncbi:MAG TPA: SigE family RNA polymerase sigma factor [Marmoricola sp.]|nr:SigE family RNA polymerase sigma factor [Marmoricola sp.]
MRSQDLAFGEFALIRSPRLYRSALLLCGNEHTAEDLVQETLAKLYVAWPRVNDPVAYAHVALTRTFLSHVRRRSTAERPTAVLPDGEHLDQDATQRTDLIRALAELDPRDRAVLVLRYLEDQPVDQVAQILRIKPGAVRTRTHRALRRIRVVLGDFDAEEALR